MMEKLNHILNSFVAVGDDTKDKVLGASFTIVNKHGPLYQGTAGRIACDVDSPSFSLESSGWIASMTKIITATSLMQIVEKGLVQLDDDVRPLVPELASAQILRGFDGDDKPILENNDNPITLRHLLTHTSGLGYDMADPDLQRWSQVTGRTENAISQTREGFNTPLKFRPGESWYYGSSMDWAGLTLEKITGQTLGEYMSENIFEPLGMSDTTFRRQRTAERFAGRMIQWTHRGPDGTLGPGAPVLPEDPAVDGGGGGLYSTAKDFARFLQALVAAGEGHGPLLRKETVDATFEPQLDEGQCQTMQTILRGILPFPEDALMNHGLGGVVTTADAEGKRRKGSLAWAGMTNGQWWIDRQAGIAAALVVNLLPPDDACVKKLYDELERAVYGNFLPAS